MARTYDTDELTKRARALEDAIHEKRERIRKLQGLPTSGDKRARWWNVNSEVEVEHDLPALDPALAHEALFESIYEETGLIGAVRTSGSDFEWKVFDEQRSPQRLKVRLEGGLDAPKLRVSGHAPEQQRRNVLAAGAGLAMMVGLVLSVALLSLSVAPWMMMIAVSVSAIGLLLAVLLTRRRRTSRSLREIAQRIAEPLPLRTHRARVEVEAEDEREEEIEERTQTKERSARGVS